MFRITPSSGLLCAAALALSLSGCNSAAPVPAPSGQATDTGHADHGDHDHAGHEEAGDSDMDKMKAELAKLSPEDAASAARQQICPVGGEMLGTMGAPIKVEVNGQEVWLCCGGCKDQLLSNPEKHLAKLKKE